MSLSGFLGFIAGRGSQIGSSAAQAWGVAPSISWAAFDLGSVRARLRAVPRRMPTPRSPVMSSRCCWRWRIGKRLQRLRPRSGPPVVAAAPVHRQRAAQQAEIRYREGTADFLVLLDAERERLLAEDAQAQAEVELYRGVVAIYKALGGGWRPSA